MPIWRNRGFVGANEGSASSRLNRIVRAIKRIGVGVLRAIKRIGVGVLRAIKRIGVGVLRAIKRIGVLRLIELIAVVIAIIAFFIELNYRHEERTARAWQALTIKAAGNSGKIEALKYLNTPDYWFFQDRWPSTKGWDWLPFTKGRVSLRGIDLTPPVLDERWKGRSKQKRVLWNECPHFVYLRGVNLADANLISAVLVCADLQEANLQGADLRHADLQGAYLPGADLRGATFGGLGQEAVYGAPLKVDTDRQRTKLRSAFLYKADLRKVKGLNCPQLKEASIKEVTINGKRVRVGWNSACREKELACEEDLPPTWYPDKPCRDQPDPEQLQNLGIIPTGLRPESQIR